MKSIFAITLLIMLVLPHKVYGFQNLQGSDPAINKAIEANRKGELIVKAKRGATVKVEQLRHEFWFGCAISNSIAGGSWSAETKKMYKEKFLENFNSAVTENAVKWGTMEPRKGEVNYRIIDTILKFTDDNMMPLRGHNIFWGIPQFVQPWVKELNDADLKQTLQNRAETLGARYKGRFTEYDLNNEMIHGNYYEDRLGPDITKLMAQWVHNGDPDAKLWLNDYDILTGKRLSDYMKQIRLLLSQGVPIAGIGVQGHLHGETFDRSALVNALDSLAIFKLPIRVTEFNLPGQRSKYYEKKITTMTPEEELQKAKDIVDYYRICFAHPAVEGILMWGFWEGANWIPVSSLYKRDWTPTPAANAYKKLIFNEWWTNASGKAGKDGLFSTRAFYGKYRVTVDGVSKEIDLSKANGKVVVEFKMSIVHPIIAERTVTVGGGEADIKGFTSQAIQTAIEALKNNGGGTVKLFPGTYDITGPVKLFSNMHLTGSGEKTILRKCDGFRSVFALDADYGELRVTVSDASGFKPGMGVAIYDDDQRYGWDLTTARITAIIGDVVYIDDYLLRDYRSGKNGTISNACSVIEAVEAENIMISNLTVDGNAGSNDKIDGCRAGGIYIHKVAGAIVENVMVKNFNSDGISWQLTENVTVKNCEIYGCTNSGLHPGTGSPYTLIEGNNSHDNGGYGLFVCWRVRDGVVRNNSFSHNGNNGICTGHKDTDMLFEGNHVFENGSDGIHLRGETPLNAPHRSVFRKNIIENNGTRKGGYGFSMNCKAEDVVLEDNIIRNTGSGKQKAAVYLLKNSIPVKLINNQISGHPEGEVVDEK